MSNKYAWLIIIIPALLIWRHCYWLHRGNQAGKSLLRQGL
jgi:hypothetical protein